jgi:hypothetical protein
VEIDMARPKGAKNKKHVFKDPKVESVVEEWVEFTCPVRGKVKQKVKIKKIRKVNMDGKMFVGARDIIEDLESKEGDISSTDAED